MADFAWSTTHWALPFVPLSVTLTIFQDHLPSPSPVLHCEGRWGTTDDFTISFFHFSFFPPPSWTWRAPGVSIPWCFLPTSSCVCLVFFPLSLRLARWFLPDLMKGRHVHTTSVCISLFMMIRRFSCGPTACWILAQTSLLVIWSFYKKRSI